MCSCGWRRRNEGCWAAREVMIHRVHYVLRARNILSCVYALRTRPWQLQDCVQRRRDPSRTLSSLHKATHYDMNDDATTR